MSFQEGFKTRLTWSLTPHSPAERLAAGGIPCGLYPTTTNALLQLKCRAGLTPKPHHAHQPRVGLRGSFRLRLASTFNHRPGLKPSGFIIDYFGNALGTLMHIGGGRFGEASFQEAKHG